FEEELPAFEAENTSPDAIEVDRDDGDVEPSHDALESMAKGKETARARDGAFGEDANQLAGLERHLRLAQRLNDFSRGIVVGNGNCPHQLREPVNPLGLIKFPVPDEPDKALGAR